MSTGPAAGADAELPEPSVSPARWEGPFCWVWKDNHGQSQSFLGHKDVRFGFAGLPVRVTHSPSPVFLGDRPAWFVFCFAP